MVSKVDNTDPTVPKQAKANRYGVINPQNYNFKDRDSKVSRKNQFEFVVPVNESQRKNNPYPHDGNFSSVPVQIRRNPWPWEEMVLQHGVPFLLCYLLAVFQFFVRKSSTLWV